MEERLLGGSALSIKTPETAIHQTGSSEVTWHTGKQNFKNKWKRGKVGRFNKT